MFLAILFDPTSGLFAREELPPSAKEFFLLQTDNSYENPVVYAIRHADKNKRIPSFLGDLAPLLLKARNVKSQGIMHVTAEHNNASALRYLTGHWR